MMALICIYLIFTNREDHILSRKNCIASQLAFAVNLKSLHLSNIRYTLTEMSLVERNDLNVVMKSFYLAGQLDIVQITAEPSTTKPAASTVQLPKNIV